jgi:hypothetical protein
MADERVFYIGVSLLIAAAVLLIVALCIGCTSTHVIANADGSWEFSNRAFLADATNGKFRQEPAEGGGMFVVASFDQRAYEEGQSATNVTLRSVTNSIAWLGAVVSGAGGNVLGTLTSVTVGWLTRDKITESKE